MQRESSLTLRVSVKCAILTRLRYTKPVHITAC